MKENIEDKLMELTGRNTQSEVANNTTTEKSFNKTYNKS
jgi:hypothetical protein